MELKNEFKQMDIGVYPTDWSIQEIKNLGSINGRVGWKGYTKKDLKDSGPYTIGAKHIDNQNRLDLSDPTYLSYEKFIESPEIKIQKDDILIVQRGTIGKVVHVEDDIGDATINPSMLILRFVEVLPKYAYLYLVSNWGQKQILEDTSSTGVPMITQKQVLSFKLPLPPTKAEQTAIATALGDMDNLIASLEKLIEKKKAIKQGAMQELLRPKEGWVVKTFGELFEITSSKRVFQSEWKTSGVPFYRAREIAVLGDNGFVENELFISTEMYEKYKAQYGVPQKDDLLVTGVGTLGKVYLVEGNHDFYFKDGNIIWFKINNSINTEFIKQLFSTKVISRQIEDASAGTTVGTYTITGAKNTLIPFPPRKEQNEIANILSDLDTQVSSLEQNLAKYKLLKIGMMQELLTGKTRLV